MEPGDSKSRYEKSIKERTSADFVIQENLYPPGFSTPPTAAKTPCSISYFMGHIPRVMAQARSFTRLGRLFSFPQVLPAPQPITRTEPRFFV
jgi:hypothetical protein